MTAITKTKSVTPVKIRFGRMMDYLHKYVNHISCLQVKANGLTRNEYFRVSRTQTPGSDTHVFTGKKYTIQITIRMNEPEKGGAA